MLDTDFGVGQIVYRYDGAGNRMSKSVSGAVSSYYYSGDQEILETDGSGATVRRYVRLPGSVDEPLAMIDYTLAGGCGGSLPLGCVRYAHQDRLGSVIAVSDGSDGALEALFSYSPYGMSGTEGDAGFPFRFTGQKVEAETGLYYYKARYYDPEIGRFLQTDPIGYEDQQNWYVYTANDPVNLTDPTGKCPNCVTGAIGGGIGGVVGGVTGFFTTSGGIGDRLLGAGAGAAGGAVTGAIIGGTGNVVGGFAAGGATTSVVRQLTTGDGQVSVAETAVDTAVSATVGKVVPGVKVPGITSGNGSFQHVANTQTTRLAQGQISSVSGTTAGKAVVAGAVGGSAQTAATTTAGIVRDGVINGVNDATAAINGAIDTAQSVASGIVDSIPQNPVNQCDLGGPC